jgi:hypothetical protein
MATKVITLKLINNLSVNDAFTYQIWKSNGTRIVYGNGISVPNFRMNINSSAPYNIQLGATKEQTIQNIYNTIISYNYTYTGLSYSYSGDELTISINNADGFEHRINCIRVPNNMIVKTGTPCSTTYIYNNSTLYNYFQQYSAGLTITRNGASYSSGNYPSQIDDEIDRAATYVYNSYPTTSIISNYQIVTPRGLTSSDVSHTLNNNSALITITPFTNFNYTNYYFNLNDGAWQTTRDIYGLLPNTTNNIDIIDKWGCKLDYPITTGSLDFGFTNYPQIFAPVYNPLYYKFALPNYQDDGFRYLINLTNEITGESIADFTIIPDIDGSGYIDVSKYLSNFTTVDYNGHQFESFISDCTNSYIKYSISLGYEINEPWNYLSYTASTVNGITYTKLVQDDQVTANTFAAGDQIAVTTLNGITVTLNGLHTVLETTPYSVTIDVLYPGTSSTPIGGSVRYSDNRKTKYNNVYTLQNNIAWNGALDWKKYRNYQYTQYYMEDGSGEPDVFLLTSMRSFNSYLVNEDPLEYYVTPSQDLYFNFAYDAVDKDVFLFLQDDEGNTSQYVIGSSGGYVRQFCLNINQIYAEGGLNQDFKYVTFYLLDSTDDVPISLQYRLYVDNRCTIEDYEILFMDRLGSVLSFAFQLRAKETGKVERDMYNKYIDFFSGSSATPEYTNTTLQLRDAGKTIYNVDLTEELELNTNWMNDEMSVLFDELITSPYTWIKIDGTVYPCIVKDNGYEVERQKNKNLIRKTVKVELSNKKPINI